jgi:SAM-dependent methyltransferase
MRSHVEERTTTARSPAYTSIRTRFRVGQRWHQKSWDDLARIDPRWAVLSVPSLRFGGWETESMAYEFLRTGKEEVDHVLRVASQFGTPMECRRALDFGCGVGRMTSALSERFDSCVGVDISGEMIQYAIELNVDRTNCEFRRVRDENLAMFASEHFDLVLAELVLQHMPSSRTATTYVEEFLRVLRPGGIAIFQLPVAVPRRNRLRVRPRAYRVLRTLGVSSAFLYGTLHLHPITMAVSVPASVIEELAASYGCAVVAVEQDTTPGVGDTPRYYVRKKVDASSYLPD